MVNSTTGYDMKVQKLLDECKISSRLINYIENFEYPYVNDVQKYYESLLKIGQGTFGEVFKARCKRTGQLVALKKILMENEKEGFPITALREIKMLKLLRHPNITELIEVCTCKQKNARERFSFLFYLVFTFCEHDLAGLLSNSKIKIGLVEIKTMSKHILEGLNKIHKSNILHRDMKSANVLITSDGVLKLADFGLARLMIKQPDFRYTNRVVTLWYRPPELLLGSGNYGPSIDVWGAGCIIAELWIRTPILQGNTEQEQLVRISKLCGSINPDNWPGCEQLPLYGKLKPEFQQINGHNSAIPQNFPRRVRERIGPFLQAWADSQDSTADSEKFAHYLAFTTQQNDQALALIDQMLSLCPEQRPSAEEALDHNFFWEAPLPAENIKDLVDKLKGTNLFEYTSGCGAHANRKQRPVAPAAPGHVNGSGPNQTSRKPAISSNARTHLPPPHQQTRHAAVQIKQVQEFGVATSTKSSSNISEPISRDHKPHRQPVPDNRGFSSTVDNNLQYQQNRKRQAPPIDEHINTPPPISRPTPLAQAGSANRTISGGIWQQPPQQSSHYQQGGPVASSSSQSQQWNSHPQNFTQTGKRGTPQPLHSQPRHAWQPPIQGQHSQSQSQQYLPRTSQFQNRFPAVPAPNSQQAYNRQLPPADRHQQPRYFQ